MTISLTTWIAAGAIAAAVTVAGVQTVRLASEKTDFAEARAAWADTRAEASRMRAKAETEERNEENRRQLEKDNAIKQALAKAAVAGAAAVRADRAAVSLRESTDALVARARQACGSAEPGKGGAPASDALGVLADVQRRIDERAGILAEYADAARIAGEACERSYDSLTPAHVQQESPP